MLFYGCVQEVVFDCCMVLIEFVVLEVCEIVGFVFDVLIVWVVVIECGLVVDVDFDQLFWVLFNFVCNVVQVLESYVIGDGGLQQIWIIGKCEGVVVIFEIFDIGFGVFVKIRQYLFEVFQIFGCFGGSGFGFVIVVELVCVYGGDIYLVEGIIGVIFCIVILDCFVEFLFICNEW